MRCLALLFSVSALLAADSRSPAAPMGWTADALRDEIRPEFAYVEGAGPKKDGVFTINTGRKEGMDGFWKKTMPIEGGKHYRFVAFRRVTGAEWPQQCAVSTIQWVDGAGARAVDDRPLVSGYLTKYSATAPLEYAVAGTSDSDGWTQVTGLWQSPTSARQAVIQLHGRWSANTRVEWSGVRLEPAEPPQPRRVRLATIHFRPEKGKTAAEKRTQYASLIEQAARQKADLVVLGETLTYFNASASAAESAEPIPGPTTAYFAGLARQHNLYIVAGIFEKDGHIVYNSAVLLTPEGQFGGKYRKVTLPDSEAAAGVVPGRDYPVFPTRFGLLGIMICYDGFFPEVARELTKRGAEVIAWPVWGCNPDLARARAAENHVYLVSSTYEDVSSNWMLSAVWDHSGSPVAAAKNWGDVVVAEVDLNATTLWRSLGDFRSKLPYHTPMTDAKRSWDLGLR